MREDLVKLDKLDEQTRFLAEKKIETIDDLNGFHTQAENELADLTSQRKELRLKLRREIRADNRDGILLTKDQIHGITGQMRKLRKQLALCAGVEERSRQMAEALSSLQEEQNNEEREGNKNEQLLGRSGRTGREDDVRRR